MRRGFQLVWAGWQYDVPDVERMLRLYAPVATDNGKPITGWVRSDFVFAAKESRAVSLGHRGQKAQPAIETDSAEYKLTVRDTVLGERRGIPRAQWGVFNEVFIIEPDGKKKGPGTVGIPLKNRF